MADPLNMADRVGSRVAESIGIFTLRYSARERSTGDRTMISRSAQLFGWNYLLGPNGKGVGNQKCETTFGPFRLLTPAPTFRHDDFLLRDLCIPAYRPNRPDERGRSSSGINGKPHIERKSLIEKLAGNDCHSSAVSSLTNHEKAPGRMNACVIWKGNESSVYPDPQNSPFTFPLRSDHCQLLVGKSGLRRIRNQLSI
jgi:hypothetical protein